MKPPWRVIEGSSVTWELHQQVSFYTHRFAAICDGFEQVRSPFERVDKAGLFLPWRNW